MRRKNADIAVAALIAVLGCAAAAARMPGPVVVVLGICLFAAPGYVWEEVLLSRRAAPVERAMVATGLALLAPIFGGIAVYAAKIPLHRGAWVGLLAALTIVGTVVVAIQRGGRTPEPAAPPKPGRAGAGLPARHLVAYGAAGIIAIVAIVLSVHSAETQRYPGYTQLWMAPVVKDPVKASLGVTNQQGSTVQYRLVLKLKGKVSDTWNMALANGQTWQRTIPYTTKYSMTADLYRLPNLSQPYRTVDNGG